MRSAIRALLGVCLLALAGGLAGAAAPPPDAAPSDVVALVTKAASEAKSGDLEAAIATLEPVRTRPDVPPQALALLGALYVQAGQPDKGLTVLRPLADAQDADPAVLYNAGRAAEALGNLESAERYLRRSATLAPSSPASRELGLMLGRENRFTDAYIALRPWATAHPDDTEARLAAALCAVELRRAPDAEELLSDLPQTDPGVRLLWGRLLLLKSDPWGAIATLKPLLEKAPPQLELETRRTMAEAYSMVGQAGDAAKLLVGRVQGRPALALLLARAQYKSGDLASALATLQPFAAQLLDQQEMAKKADDDKDLAHDMALDYGRYLVASAKQQEAIGYLQLATELSPEDKQGWQLLGQALAAAGRRDEAKQALERFQQISQNEVPASVRSLEVEHDAQDPTGRALREAMKLVGQDRPEEALQAVRKEADLAPQDPRPRLLEASILLRLQQPQKALEVAGQAVTMAPQSADAFYQRGASEMALHQLDAAEKDYRKALEISPDHTAAMNDLAVLLMTRGDDEEAKQLLQRVLELHPDDAVAARNLKSLDPGKQGG